MSNVNMEKILSTAENIIREKGVEEFSYEDLSFQTGVPVNDIVKLFPKRSDFIEALINQCSVVYGGNYKRIAASDKTAIEKLESIVEMYDNGLKKDEICLVAVLRSEYHLLIDANQNSLNKVIQDTNDIFEQIFIQGQKEGSINPDLKTAETAYGFYSFLLGAQIMTRSVNDIDNFKNIIGEYLKRLK